MKEIEVLHVNHADQTNRFARSPQLLLGACLLILSAGGCQQPADPSNTTNTGANAVELTVLDYRGIQKFLADQRGKVVVLDAWSTSCPPCMEEFHNLVEIDQEYSDADVTCVSLSFDYDGIYEEMDRYQEPVLAFLKQENATCTNILSSTDDSTLYKKFEFGSIPAVFVYDQQGNLVERCENSIDSESGIYDKVRAHLKRLTSQPTAPPAASDSATPDAGSNSDS